MNALTVKHNEREKTLMRVVEAFSHFTYTRLFWANCMQRTSKDLYGRFVFCTFYLN